MLPDLFPADTRDLSVFTIDDAITAQASAAKSAAERFMRRPSGRLIVAGFPAGGGIDIRSLPMTGHEDVIDGRVAINRKGRPAGS